MTGITWYVTLQNLDSVPSFFGKFGFEKFNFLTRSRDLALAMWGSLCLLSLYLVYCMYVFATGEQNARVMHSSFDKEYFTTFTAQSFDSVGLKTS